MGKKKHTSEEIVTWLSDKPHLSISAIERSAEIPAGLLAKAIKGVQAISEKHITKLVEVLKIYGYK